MVRRFFSTCDICVIQTNLFEAFERMLEYKTVHGTVETRPSGTYNMRRATSGLLPRARKDLSEPYVTRFNGFYHLSGITTSRREILSI